MTLLDEQLGADRTNPMVERTLEQKRRILRHRARLLARSTTRASDPEQNLNFVEFLLSGERYAVESVHVREVLVPSDITPVPCTPQHIHGIINVRGKIISVMDLRVLFGLPHNGPSPKDKVLILTSENMEFGILAEELVGAETAALDAVHPPPSTMQDGRGTYLRGIIGTDLILLDAVKLLSDPTLLVNEES
ncbi:purine-binding chemotaxis protein CheW [Desulfonatronum thiosulfatophilum]|uniref:Purine-binding chemotaxis protein CheW n=1 Tax=Desulfonatronum thiosulfatophilum TaxID=617002 RepID=A0A1G6A076_9BACT|nr:chemotaxis protein CheW [Desulfonatronum thiosulfatophilum]SDB01844.1 purine-binding chemotaxis protein CheW [Desulfonatronum thiosulfatophilum]